MDEQKVLMGLIKAHQLLRHDFMNNLQVITGFQKIGQPEKAEEYLQRTVAYLRRFNGVGKIECPLLQGLLIMYLTQYSDPAVFEVKVENTPALCQEKEAELAGLLYEVMKVLEQPLCGGKISCQIMFGQEEDKLLQLMLTGQAASLFSAQHNISPLLKKSFLGSYLRQTGNTIFVEIRSTTNVG